MSQRGLPDPRGSLCRAKLPSLGAMTKPFRHLHQRDEGGVEAVGGVEAEGVSIHLTVGGVEAEGGAVDGVEAVGRVGEAPLLLR
ncbi:MAG: hypothetical protein WDW38_003585 [Sanguina aurantia]